MFEISTAIKAVKVHILFVKYNFSFTTALPPARLSVDRGPYDQQEVTDDILKLQQNPCIKYVGHSAHAQTLA